MYRFRGVVGYHFCLTHRRSPVRARAKSAINFFTTIFFSFRGEHFPPTSFCRLQWEPNQTKWEHGVQFFWMVDIEESPSSILSPRDWALEAREKLSVVVSRSRNNNSCSVLGQSIVYYHIPLARWYPLLVNIINRWSIYHIRQPGKRIYQPASVDGDRKSVV